MMRARFLIGVLVVCLLAACGRKQEAPTPTITPSPAPTRTALPPTPTVDATATPEQRSPELLIEATDIRQATASTDGEWLAFWMRGDGDGLDAPLTLSFFPLSTRLPCRVDEVVAPASEPFDADLSWLDDGRLLVHVGGEELTGRPCEAFIPSPSFEGAQQTLFSPNGEFRATTVHEGTTAATEIVDRSSGQILNRVQWTHTGSDDQTCCAGGVWLDDERYLIERTQDRGPLLADIRGNVVSVVTGLFSESFDPEGSDTLRAYALSDPIGGETHILLERAGEPVLMHHGESEEIETLPFISIWGGNFEGQYLGGFSPDGQWLLGQMPREDGVFMRPLHGDDESIVGLIDYAGDATWNPAGTSFTVDDGESVEIWAFPEAVQLEVWTDATFLLSTGGWISNRDVLLVGMTLAGDSTGRYALFLADR